MYKEITNGDFSSNELLERRNIHTFVLLELRAVVGLQGIVLNLINKNKLTVFKKIKRIVKGRVSLSIH